MKFIIEKFEEEIKSNLGSICSAVVAVSSGWAALYTVLSTMCEKGKEVITTPFTFQATTNAIINAGLKPVFVDIGDDSLIDASQIEKAITKDTVAILPVHLFGRACDMSTINRLAFKHDLLVIEDAAQSFLGQYRSAKLGTLGNFGCYSFYATKNLSTFEGGAISINYISGQKLELVERSIRSMISHGQDEKHHFIGAGINARMTAQSALVGYERLKLHKDQIIHSLGRLSERDGYYPYVTYEHDYIKKLGITGNCPKAEELARCIKENKFL